MPNWCSNTLKISHSDPSKVEALAEAFKNGNFCESVIPLPKFDNDPSGMEEYRFCVDNWGTKWDIEPDFADCYDQDGAKHLYVEFKSAWSPPIGVYRALHAQGFAIEARYAESGAGFIGQFKDGVDNCRNISSDEDSYSLGLF